MEYTKQQVFTLRDFKNNADMLQDEVVGSIYTLTGYDMNKGKGPFSLPEESNKFIETVKAKFLSIPDSATDEELKEISIDIAIFIRDRWNSAARQANTKLAQAYAGWNLIENDPFYQGIRHRLISPTE